MWENSLTILVLHIEIKNWKGIDNYNVSIYKIPNWKDKMCKNYLHNTKRFVLKAKKLFTMKRMIVVVVVVVVGELLIVNLTSPVV